MEIRLNVTSNTFITRKLFAIIRWDRMRSDRQRLQEFDDCISYSLSCLGFDLSQKSQSLTSIHASGLLIDA